MTVDLLPVLDLSDVLFQVVDDYKELWGEAYGNLEGFGGNLTEGKFLFLVVTQHQIMTRGCATASHSSTEIFQYACQAVRHSHNGKDREF